MGLSEETPDVTISVTHLMGKSNLRIIKIVELGI
jgi:hypothetical protein